MVGLIRTEIASGDVVEQKRLFLYASLMRYGAETVPLRERAIDRLVLSALLGSTSGNTFKNGAIQKTLRDGLSGLTLRPEIINESLSRLESQGKVVHVTERLKDAFFLPEQGANSLGEIIRSAEDMLGPVLSRLLENTEAVINREVAQAICKKFFCLSFARFGAAIAKGVVGQPAEHLSRSELLEAFDAATQEFNLSADATETLRARCIGFFKSADPNDRNLIFHLTQSFYFAQIIGIEQGPLSPLADQAFSGARFYLDTNVLFTGLFPGDKGAAFSELLNAASRVGIQLSVSRATLNEARRVIGDRARDLPKIAAAIPPKLAEKSSDEFVRHFYEQREIRPDLTAEEFLADFEILPEIVQTRWGIEIVELTEEEMLRDRDLDEARSNLEKCCAGPSHKKSAPVFDHDLAMYAQVTYERTSSPKTWMLTRDQTLLKFAQTLCHPPEKSYCFTMLGFLQSISPFLASDSELSLEKFFGGLLNEQLFTSERFFDSKELVLFAEMQSDVLHTPIDQLMPAIDFVKTHILRGSPYRTEFANEVSLGLRKFIACSSDEQRKALELEAEKLVQRSKEANYRADEETRKRMAVESTLSDREAELDTLRGTVAGLSESNERLRLESASNGDLKVRIEQMELRDQRRIAQNRRLINSAAILVLTLIYFSLRNFNVQISGAVAGLLPNDFIKIGALQGVVRLVSWLVVGLPGCLWIGSSNLRVEIKTTIIAFAIVACLGSAGVSEWQFWGTASNYLTLAIPLACLLVFRKEREN